MGDIVQLRNSINSLETLQRLEVHVSARQEKVLVDFSVERFQCKTLRLWYDARLCHLPLDRVPTWDRSNVQVKNVCHSKVITELKMPHVNFRSNPGRQIDLGKRPWTVLQLDWPSGLTNKIVADLLVRHRDTLEVGVLRITHRWTHTE